jgi:hypothetical protein
MQRENAVTPPLTQRQRQAITACYEQIPTPAVIRNEVPEEFASREAPQTPSAIQRACLIRAEQTAI